jgi:hypothetical protein
MDRKSRSRGSRAVADYMVLVDRSVPIYVEADN